MILVVLSCQLLKGNVRTQGFSRWRRRDSERRKKPDRDGGLDTTRSIDFTDRVRMRESSGVVPKETYLPKMSDLISLHEKKKNSECPYTQNGEVCSGW